FAALDSSHCKSGFTSGCKEASGEIDSSSGLFSSETGSVSGVFFFFLKKLNATLLSPHWILSMCLNLLILYPDLPIG
ncbi:MAG: hypothetical protein OQK71_00495, partial [Desulfobacter sp.]|nr:hypothetical protein [Desulfobacter sp.]